MPRAMDNPNYKYSPWTPERRLAASERAKARHQAKLEEEDRIFFSPIGRVEDRLFEEHDKLEAARTEYFRAEKAIKDLTEAVAALRNADTLLIRHGVEPLNFLDEGGERKRK